MAGYLFFPSADHAQDDIWRYTCEEWGEKQAEKYIYGRHDHLQALSEKKKFWHVAPDHLVVPPDLELKVYFRKYEHHSVFFREFSDERIGVMSILHEHADIPVRLNTDLKHLSE